MLLRSFGQQATQARKNAATDPKLYNVPMTLILGAHLTRKLYLVSDTRLTLPGGKTEDDFIKAVTFNSRISCVAAGSVALASHVVRAVKKEIRTNSSISYINYIHSRRLGSVVKDYVNETGRVNESASFIFGGFNLNRCKTVDSGRLGAVMSAVAKLQPEGKLFTQYIDPTVTHALCRAIEKNRGVLHSKDIEIPEIIQSQMLAFQIRTYQNDLYVSPLEEVSTYDYAIFHPQQSVEKVELPVEMLSELDFRIAKDGETGKKRDFYSLDAAILASFVLAKARERQFSSVGGNILVQLITPQGSIFRARDMIDIRGEKPTISSLFVEDGVMCYRLPSGKTGRYRHLESACLPSGTQTI